MRRRGSWASSGPRIDGSVIRRLVFAIRQSPDWHALAEDHAAGRPIDPARFVPPGAIPSFPADVAELIVLWNATFATDFFRVRAVLKDIARGTLAAIDGATVLEARSLPASLPERGARDWLLFFLDDDDWFAPDTLARIGGQIVGDEDVAVFPLVRIDVRSFTFLRAIEPGTTVVGLASRFATRYQTNNYALLPRACRARHLAGLQEHLDASEYATRAGLRDRYYDVLISATNKAPASASILHRLREDPVAFRAYVIQFVAHLRGLALPHAAGWMRPPLERTVALLEAALG